MDVRPSTQIIWGGYHAIDSFLLVTGTAHTPPLTLLRFDDFQTRPPPSPLFFPMTLRPFPPFPPFPPPPPSLPLGFLAMITLLPYVDSLKALHPSTWLTVFLTHDAPLLLFRRFLHLRYHTNLETWTHQEDES